VFSVRSKPLLLGGVHAVAVLLFQSSRNGPSPTDFSRGFEFSKVDWVRPNKGVVFRQGSGVPFRSKAFFRNRRG